MLDPAVAWPILEELKRAPEQGVALRQRAMQMLSGLPGYDWCGIYRLEGDELVLDAYVGAETDHTRIPVGRGVCGTAIAENRNQVIVDVRILENYLACSTQTRSELVVLIRNGASILGQVDIDGHRVDQFNRSDEAFLEALAEILASRWTEENVG
jgi:GAF domain-containing protein